MVHVGGPEGRGLWGSDSRYLPQQRCLDEVVDDQFTRMTQESRFVSAVQSERSEPVPRPRLADEEPVGSLSAHESELSETIHPSVGQR